MPMPAYSVRAAHCDHRASEDQIYETMRRITSPLERSWERLENARRVVIKLNMLWPPPGVEFGDGIQYFEGRRQELVDDAVLRAVLRLLRERTSAEVIVTDTTAAPDLALNFRSHLDDFGVEYLESNDPPSQDFDVPGGGCMFSRYQLSTCFAQADAVVSLAKMKNHGFMGVTLCLKNLFGLPPMPPHGRYRRYYHHIIRLSHVLPDLGMITRPCLNIIDGLVGQSRREWGGEGRVANVLVAGDHAVSTDACGAWLMGHDPAGDWPTPPYRRDRNPLLVAAEHGFGTVDLDQIDFETDVEPPVASFDSVEVDSPETVKSWRRTTCEQALYYREHQERLTESYSGEFLFLQDDQVVWHGPDPANLGSRRKLSGARKDSALWMKWVDPEEAEGEHFEVYERILGDLA